VFNCIDSFFIKYFSRWFNKKS